MNSNILKYIDNQCQTEAKIVSCVVIHTDFQEAQKHLSIWHPLETNHSKMHALQITQWLALIKWNLLIRTATYIVENENIYIHVSMYIHIYVYPCMYVSMCICMYCRWRKICWAKYSRFQCHWSFRGNIFALLWP